MNDVEVLTKAIRRTWRGKPSSKAEQYVGAFWDRIRRGSKITAQVEGNHGTYTVSLTVSDDDKNKIDSGCSCYIGGHGGCHHCVALAHTFLLEPHTFTAIESTRLEEVSSLDDLKRYLEGVTLDELVGQLRANGITQKAFAESIGMSTQHLSAVKRSEARNRYFHELGAAKLACVWVLQNLTDSK